MFYHICKCIVLGFYVTDQHNMVHNCQVEGNWYMVLIILQIKHRKVWCAKLFTPLSQYFVKPPLAAMTAASLLGYVSTSDAHIVTEILAHSSLQNSSSLVWLDGEWLWTAIFKSCQRFLSWFGSGLGHSNTWICFDLNHSIVALAVCLGSLSCWKVNLHPSLRSLADS